MKRYDPTYAYGFLLPCLLILALGACHQPTTSGDSALKPSSPNILNIDWKLTSFQNADGTIEAVPDSAGVTLRLDDSSRAGGNSGCNVYGTSYTMGVGTLAFDENIRQTKRGCMSPYLWSLEPRFLNALRQADRFEVSAGSLTIFFSNPSGALHFRAP